MATPIERIHEIMAGSEFKRLKTLLEAAKTKEEQLHLQCIISRLLELKEEYPGQLKED